MMTWIQFGQWNTVLGDNCLTAVLIDRLFHHAHILAYDGESYCLRHALSAINTVEPVGSKESDA
ncbi:hypothetical protein MHLNE_16240 [Moorella humiferrea]|uniref:ATP-binding protein n=1 Tax=Neomoorella humiferrea TaxID=676965 RepID=UPI0030D3F497